MTNVSIKFVQTKSLEIWKFVGLRDVVTPDVETHTRVLCSCFWATVDVCVTGISGGAANTSLKQHPGDLSAGHTNTHARANTHTPAHTHTPPWADQ